MSQRLLITYEKLEEQRKIEYPYYDAIYTENSNVETLKEWACYSENLYLRPFKVTIENYGIIDKFKKDFKYLCSTFLNDEKIDDIWMVFDFENKNIHIEHPTEKEFDDFVKMRNIMQYRERNYK